VTTGAASEKVQGMQCGPPQRAGMAAARIFVAAAPPPAVNLREQVVGVKGWA
jgi:hypothetical protein